MLHMSMPLPCSFGSNAVSNFPCELPSKGIMNRPTLSNIYSPILIVTFTFRLYKSQDVIGHVMGGFKILNMHVI